MSILEENWHPLTRKFPLIGGGQPGDPEWDAFRTDIARTRGNVEPATYRMIRGVKQWLDGRNRLLADEQLGLPFYAKKELLNDKEAFLWIISRNVRRRHLTAEQRRGIVQELRNEGMKIKDIADAVGVDPRTIDRDLHQVDEDSKNTTNVVSALENPSNCSPSEEGPDEPPNVLADPITSEQAAMDAEPTPWEPAPESPPSPAPAPPPPPPPQRSSRHPSCPTCAHAMQPLLLSTFWCPRCGTTIRPNDTFTVPALVYRCRSLQVKLADVTPDVAETLDLLGITESIHPSVERSPTP